VFRKNPRADIITFKTKTYQSDKEYREYSKNSFTHNLSSLFQVSSIESAFRLNEIKKSILNFDIQYGLGTFFNSGEEVIFLIEALKKGLLIKFVPYYIVKHPYMTPFPTNNKKNIRTLGALFYRTLGILYFFRSTFRIL
jgi:hypothetical protein